MSKALELLKREHQFIMDQMRKYKRFGVLRSQDKYWEDIAADYKKAIKILEEKRNVL